MIVAGIGGMTMDVLNDLLLQYERNNLMFYTEYINDINIPYYTTNGFRVITDKTQVERHFKTKDRRYLVLIGENHRREFMVNDLASIGGEAHYLHSPLANFNMDLSQISKVNTIIMSFSQVSAGTLVEEGAIISQYSYAGHHAVIKRYSFLGAYSGISEGEIGEYAFVGVKTAIIPGCIIGKDVFVGACSMVNTSIPDNKKAFGVPIKIFDK